MSEQSTPSSGADSEAASAADVLEGRELLVASNREPYSHGYDEDGELTVSRPAGGLTSALDPILQRLSGTWVAWGSGDADFDVADEQGCVQVPPEDPSYTIRRLRLGERQVEGYYYGYSNQVLWPLCHGMPSRANFEGEFWRRYRQVNQTFADAIVDAADTDDPVVWFHDYHLALAPRRVRQALPEAFLTQFWHIPWPSWAIFRTCPQHRELLEGLLANDLLGFHADAYCEAFVECVEAALDAEVDEATGAVTYDGHTTYVRSFPLGIDADAFREMAASEEAERFWEEFSTERKLGDRVAIGVDRLDYTKGILQRLDALEWLWESRPERRGTLTYVQKASESRSRIDEYRELQQEVERRVGEINDRFGTDDWTPVVYLKEHVSREGLAGLYRHADVALVSPLRDGMNLVAKEYVASQIDDDGVLVLSELAGAAESLGDDALVINPNDTGEFATTIEAALSMPERTRQRRMRSLRRRVHADDDEAWVADQFRTVAAIEHARRVDVDADERYRWQSTPVSVWGRRQRLVNRILAADGLLVMCDFDGTLADIVEDPADAAIREEAREALSALVAHRKANAAVVSGRALDDVRDRVGVEGAYYAGNHGLEILAGDERIVHPAVERTRSVLERVCEDVERRLADVDGVIVEDKGATATVHYRQVDGDGDGVRDAVEAALDAHDGSGTVRVTEGKQVVELRPAVDWDKGRAVEWLREELVPDDERWLAVYVGDDVTDEAAFEVLVGGGVGVVVGADVESSAAPYAVNDPAEVADLLGWLAEEGTRLLDVTRREGPVVESP